MMTNNSYIRTRELGASDKHSNASGHESERHEGTSFAYNHPVTSNGKSTPASQGGMVPPINTTGTLSLQGERYDGSKCANK